MDSRLLSVGVFTIVLSSCSGEQRISTRGEKISGGEQSETAGENPESPGNQNRNSIDNMPLPEGVDPGVSPFAKRKVWMPDQSLNLSDSGKPIPAVIIYENDPECESLIPTVPGIQSTKFEIFKDEFSITALLPPDYDAERFLASVACVIGIVYNPLVPSELPKNENPLTNGFALTSRNMDAHVDWDSAVNEYFGGFTEKAKVAIIDTGLDLKNKAFAKALTKDMRVTSSYFDARINQQINGDDPSDVHGHGTEVASLIAHESHGYVPNHVELIPIKVSENGAATASNFLNGISMAVNKGSDIISISMGQNFPGCNPAVGYAMYKAREKGAMFVVSAGNGLVNQSGVAVGYPVVAARDDGPASYEMTETPACWARYFLGSVAVAAVDPEGDKLADFSNYGDDIELSAPGVKVPSIGLKGAETESTGTSISVAYATAAAALAISHHRSKGFRFSPWYIENLLVESAAKDPEAHEIERRVRFGSRVSFRNLAVLLSRTEEMTVEERRNNIRTINPRQGDGWKPGEDQANLRLLKISMTPIEAYPGETISYKAHAFYRHGPEAEVTSSKNTRPSISDEKLAKVSVPGTIQLSEASAFDFSKSSTINLSLTLNYDEKQAQAFATAQFIVKRPHNWVDPSATTSTTAGDSTSGSSSSGSSSSGSDPEPPPPPPELQEITIEAPKTPVRVFQTYNAFKANGKYSDGSVRDLTGTVVWSTSGPDELRVTDAAGVLDAMEAVAGKSYLLKASYQGITGERIVAVVDETLSTFVIHNYLGQGGEVEVGQKVTLEPRFILSDKREIAANAVWMLNGAVINDGKKSSVLEIDTKDMAMGRYTYEAVAVFKRRNDLREVKASIVINLGDGIDRIEIHMKSPIVQVDQEFQIDLRAYRKNNSYVVVTEQTKWTSDAGALLSINSAGIGYVDPNLGTKTIRVTAEYKTRKVTMSINAIMGSIVTGSNALIDHLIMTVTPYSYCQRPGVSVVAKYKDGTQRNLSIVSLSFSEKQDDGSFGNMILPLYGGREYRVSATYNDGNVEAGGGGNAVLSAEFKMPKTKLNKLDFTYSGRPVDPNLKLFQNVYQLTNVDGVGICRISKIAAEPASGLSIQIQGASVRVIPPTSTKGDYVVKAEAPFTGQGYDETIEGSFAVNIDRAIPTKLLLEPQNTDFSTTGKLIYGDQVIDVKLYDKDNRSIIFTTADIELKLMQESRVIDYTTDSRHNISYHSPHQLTLSAFPKSMNLNYSLSARHKETNLQSALNFKQVGSWESKDVTDAVSFEMGPAWTLSGYESLGSFESPTWAQPKNNTTKDPVCAADPVAGLAHPFAGGAGTAQSPHVLCTVEQFNQMDEYCRTARTCGFFILGADINFNGGKVTPVKNLRGAEFDFKNRVISNFLAVDSELSNVGLFAYGPKVAKNLVIVNPTVRGSSYVGALMGSTSGLVENVHVVGGVVWGRQQVGAISGNSSTSPWRNVSVHKTEVRYESYYAGGIVGVMGSGQLELIRDNQPSLVSTINPLDKCFSSANVAPSGVPGTTQNIGGVVGYLDRHMVRNCLVTGNVITLNSFTNETQVGGIAGYLRDSIIIDSEMRGNIVSTGSAVGGIAGVIEQSYTIPSRSGFGLELPEAFAVTNRTYHITNYTRTAGVVRSKFSGSAWGGMSRKKLECLDEVVVILGVGGSTNCVGDTTSQTGGYSNVGGIVGRARHALIQDSSFTGKVRGISNVGGVAGQIIVSNLVRNTSNGIISASAGVSDYGGVVGMVEFHWNRIISRLDSNSFTSNDSGPTWGVGRWGTTLKQTIDNVPADFDR
jgi:hypothetical protein